MVDAGLAMNVAAQNQVLTQMLKSSLPKAYQSRLKMFANY
jgi:hypothetical protein